MRFTRHLSCLILAVFLLVPPSGASSVSIEADGIDEGTRASLTDALRKKIGDLTQDEKSKSANYSKQFTRNEDGTFTGSVHVNTAGDTSLTTERYRMSLAPQGERYEVTEAEVVHTFTGLFREQGGACYSFDKFSFSREGLTLSGSNGGICEGYYQGQVYGFTVMAPDLEYDYQVPQHGHIAGRFHHYGVIGVQHLGHLGFTRQPGVSVNPHGTRAAN